MISTRPNSEGHRVLALLAAYPGELCAADIARHLYPRPRRSTPFVNGTDRADWLALVTAWEATHTAKVGRILGRLTEAGLVARCAPVRVAAWFRTEWNARGLLVALERAHPRWPGEVPPLTGWAEMVVGVDSGPGWKPPTSGAGKRVYRDLVGSGVLVPPSARELTGKGTATLSGTSP